MDEHHENAEKTDDSQTSDAHCETKQPAKRETSESRKEEKRGSADASSNQKDQQKPKTSEGGQNPENAENTDEPPKPEWEDLIKDLRIDPNDYENRILLQVLRFEIFRFSINLPRTS